MRIMDPRLFDAAGLDPYATIEEVRSRAEVQADETRRNLTFGSLGAIAAIIAIAYVLFGDGFR